MLAQPAVHARKLARRSRVFMASRYCTIRVHGDNPCLRRHAGAGARRSGASPTQAAVARHRGRARQDSRQVARGQPRRRFTRPRRHDLPAAQLREREVAPLSRGLSAARLRRRRRHVQRPPRDAARQRGPAGRQRRGQRNDRRHAERVHAAQGQHVFELGDDGRLGIVCGRRSPRVHGQPLPHDREPRRRAASAVIRWAATARCASA